MPLTSGRLDLCLVPGELGADADIGERRAVSALARAGVVVDGRPGAAASAFIDGGFRSFRFDRPAGVTLYANGQGGFGVSCPSCEAPLTREFWRAWTARRGDDPGAVTCPACRAVGPLPGLRYSPAAAFGRFALIFADVGDSSLTTEGAALISEVLPGHRVVGRRVG